MKLAATLVAALLIAAPASAEILLGAGCGSGQQTFVRTSAPASERGARIVLLQGGCAAEGPRREVIHTLTPGEPMQTTILIRRQRAAGGSSGVIDVDRAIESGGGSSQARIIRVRD